LPPQDSNVFALLRLKICRVQSWFAAVRQT
jgi:hypothetical protein